MNDLIIGIAIGLLLGWLIVYFGFKKCKLYDKYDKLKEEIEYDCLANELKNKKDNKTGDDV